MQTRLTRRRRQETVLGLRGNGNLFGNGRQKGNQGIARPVDSFRDTSLISMQLRNPPLQRRRYSLDRLVLGLTNKLL